MWLEVVTHEDRLQSRRKCQHIFLKCRYMWTKDKFDNQESTHENKYRHMETMHSIEEWSLEVSTHVLEVLTHGTNGLRKFTRNCSLLQMQISQATEIQIQKNLSLSSRLGSHILNETNFMTNEKVMIKRRMLYFWEFCSQIQMRLSSSLQVQMKKVLNLNCIPRSLSSNAINGIQEFQVSKKLWPIYLRLYTQN